MNIGVVGAGPWGRTLAAAFTKCDARVVAHDRKDPTKQTVDMGERVPWGDMVASADIDVVVGAATPDVVLDIFLACQRTRKPCFLTKPLVIPPDPERHVSDLTAPAYVDYVHLASPIYEKLRAPARRQGIASIEVSFCGDGPVRPGLPGVVDYGAHAFAIVHDLLGTAAPTELFAMPSANESSRPGAELVVAEMRFGRTTVKATMGNGTQRPRRRVQVRLAGGPTMAYEERDRVATLEIDGKQVARHPGHDPLAAMIDRFMWDVDSKRIDPHFVELSVAVGRTLSEVRKDAGLPLP